MGKKWAAAAASRDHPRNKTFGLSRLVAMRRWWPLLHSEAINTSEW